MESVKLAIAAMDLNEEIHSKNGIQIKGGKSYTKVVHRIEAFRRTFGYEYGIDTHITLGQSGAICKAVITEKNSGFIVGSGSSFTKSIAGDKSLEKCETTAIGRALASLALGGDEYASIEEINTHEERYEQPQKAPAKKEKPKTPTQEWLAEQCAEATKLKELMDVQEWIRRLTGDERYSQITEDDRATLDTFIGKQIARVKK